MTRVLHCITSLGGGGAERQLMHLANEFVQRGWDIHIALLRGGVMAAGLDPRVVVHTLPAAGNFDPRICLQLRRLIRKIQPDLVQTWLIQMDVFGGTAALSLRIPWLLTEQNSRPAYRPSIRTLLRKLLGAHSDAVVANSNAGLGYWKSGRRQVARVVPNALTLEAIDGAVASLPPGLNIPSEARVVLFAGRFSPEKNVLTLARALADVTRDDNTVALLCGDGPLEPEVRREIERLGSSQRVLLAGYITNLWSVMKRADVLVSVSHFEGRPNVVEEAMACGCPLVVSDIPAHREFLDSSNAILVDGKDAKAIAAAIRTVLGDPAGARSRAEKGRAEARQWSPAVIADAWEEIYGEALAVAGSSHHLPAAGPRGHRD